MSKSEFNYGAAEAEKFGDPFILPSTGAFPKSIKSALDLCLYLYRINSLYGAIDNRIKTYFITEIDIQGNISQEDKKRLRTMLTDDVKIFAHMQTAGIDHGIYGNAFVRVVEPFDRWLEYDQQILSLNQIPEQHIEYNWSTMKYKVPAWHTLTGKDKGKKLEELPKFEYDFIDKPSADTKRFSVIFLDPRYVTLDKAHHTNSTQYIYTVPPDMESRIKTNVIHEINNTPRGLLKAVKENKNYRFHNDEVFHFKAPTPTGVSDSGWGMPTILNHFDSIYQLQVYRKTDFAIAQDYLLPFRVFTPSPSGGITDSVMNVVMSRWKQELSTVISNRRKDLTAIHALPFDAKLSEYGGQGKGMVMYDVIDAYTNAMFDGMGFPRELFKGTINQEQMPNAIRFFERSYEWLYQAMSGLCRHICNVVIKAQGMPDVQISLKRPTVAYNAEWMQLKMQLAANREMARGDLYRELGIADPIESAVDAAREDQEIQRGLAEQGMKFEKEKTQGSMADIAMMAAEQNLQAGGAPPQGGGAPGGAPPPGGGGGGSTDYSVDPGADPLQIQQRAEQIAQTWLQMHGQQPNSHRKEMSRCEAINPTLYAAAKQAMEKMRNQGASQGRASVAQNIGQG